MRNYLDFLTNRKTNFDNYYVSVKEEKRKSYGEKYEFDVVVAVLIGSRKEKKYVIWDIDSGKDDFNWGALGSMLLTSKEALEDFKKYRYAEIKKPIVDYWVRKQKAELDEQKRKKAKTIYTTTGDYTLGVIEEFISRVLLAKYLTLNDRSIIDEHTKKTLGFENGFDKSVLTPLKAYMKIEDLASESVSDEEKAKNIVDYLVSPELNMQYERILDPEYKDDATFLSSGEEGELSALWKVQSEEEERIKSDKSLSEIEKRIKMHEFYRSPQGKQLSKLNSRRVHGGQLSFDEKEEKKKERARIIAEQIEELLITWGINYKDSQKGVEHYLYLYEKEFTKRWEQNEKFNKLISKSKKEMEAISDALEGKWDSDKLTLFGVIISIGIGVGFGIASLVSFYKIGLGIMGGIVSVIVSIYVIKAPFIRKRILLWMNSILK